jgi:hypothetical protein
MFAKKTTNYGIALQGPWSGPFAQFTLRVCDFFKFARKSGLKTKHLSTRKWPTNQKSHNL